MVGSLHQCLGAKTALSVPLSSPLPRNRFRNLPGHPQVCTPISGDHGPWAEDPTFPRTQGESQPPQRPRLWLFSAQTWTRGPCRARLGVWPGFTHPVLTHRQAPAVSLALCL